MKWILALIIILIATNTVAGETYFNNTLDKALSDPASIEFKVVEPDTAAVVAAIDRQAEAQERINRNLSYIAACSVIMLIIVIASIVVVAVTAQP